MKNYGYFFDPDTEIPLGPAQAIVSSEWLRDGRSMRLTKKVCYVDPFGYTWTASAGRVVNGLSVPWILWRIQPPFVGLAREASVLHDVACEDKVRSSKVVHIMFYNAMRANGVSRFNAWVRWVMVKMLGPRF